MTPAPTETTTPRQDLDDAALDRAIGAILGSAVADALGAKFEFGPAGLYSTEFPTPVVGGIGELVGGGSFGWAPGEFTDDTQMALALAAALEEAGGFDAGTVWRHFRAWCADAHDVGATTSTALGHESHVGAAESAHKMLGGRTGSNGSVMRIAPVGVRGVILGREELYRVAVAQSNLTHHDPIAAVAAAFVAEVIRLLVEGADFEDAISDASDMMLESPLGEVFGHGLAPALSRTWDPISDDGPTNGSARTAVAQAVWAVRHGVHFHDTVTSVIDLGGDTDTVAAIAGAMAGARFGAQAIPVRWTTYVNGTVHGPAGVRRYDAQDLIDLARRLVGGENSDHNPPQPPRKLKKLHPAGVWAADLGGAASVDADKAVISMCHTADLFKGHPVRRQVLLRDSGANPGLASVVREVVDAIDAFLAEGREVVVHCHGGRSRTTLALRAWYMRTNGVDHEAAVHWIESEWPHVRRWNASFEEFLDHQWHPGTWGTAPGGADDFDTRTRTGAAGEDK